MGDAHDIPVVYRFYDDGYGNYGRVWTMTFTKQEGKIVIVPTFYQLPEQAGSIAPPMTEERFCELASLALSNEATPEELAELTAMAEQNLDVCTRLEQLTAIWNAKSTSQEGISTGAFTRPLKRLNSHARKSNSF